LGPLRLEALGPLVKTALLERQRNKINVYVLEKMKAASSMLNIVW